MDDERICTRAGESRRDAVGRDEPGGSALDLILGQCDFRSGFQPLAAGGQILEVELPKIKLVIFVIGETLLALPARDLVEILSLTTIHFVPGCPPALEGVINVRGDVASVIRLGSLLGLEHDPTSRRAAILLGQCRLDQGQTIRSGLRVDRVIDVLDVTEESIQPPPAGIPEPLRGLATGLFLLGEAGVILLDLAQVFHAFLGIGR